MDQEYTNPPFAIDQRPISYRGSTIYAVMMRKVHKSANCSNPRSYDVVNHAFETRSTKTGGTHLTSKQYSGKDEKETEELFWRVAENMQMASEAGMLAIYFRDLDSFASKLASTTKASTPTNQPTSNTQAPISTAVRGSFSHSE